jgi:hypothetical protein
MKFSTWLNILIKEKQIDLEDSFEVETENQVHFMSYGVVVEHILMASKNEQEKIKDMIVRIDFKNGDIKHYLRHLGKCLAIQFEAA